MAKKTTKKVRTKKDKSTKGKTAKAKATKAKAKAVKSKTAKAKAAKAKAPTKAGTRKSSSSRTRRGKSAAKPLNIISTGAGLKLAGKVGSATTAAKQAYIPRKPRHSSPLTPQELEEFRNLLLKERANLAGSVSRMRAGSLAKNRQEAAGDLSKFPTSPADLGSDNFEMEFTLSMLENEGELLREIDDALNRISRGVYGICEATGEPINRARLEFEPWARYTVEYANRLEKGIVRADTEPEK